MSRIDRSPALASAAVSLSAALVGSLALVLAAPRVAAVGAVGVVLLVAALLAGSRRVVGWAGGLLFVGALAGGLSGAGSEALLVCAVGAAVAWDAGDFAVEVGRQLGRDAPTRRLELVHAGFSLLVGTLAAGVGYGVYAAATGGQPLAALVFLLFGAVVLVSTLR